MNQFKKNTIIYYCVVIGIMFIFPPRTSHYSSEIFYRFFASSSSNSISYQILIFQVIITTLGFVGFYFKKKPTC